MKELSDKGFVPNADTYQYLIAKYCRKGDLDNTNRLLMMMREQNIPIMLEVYRSLIICHSKNK
jgi:pentatricopeptide repeat protein